MLLRLLQIILPENNIPYWLFQVPFFKLLPSVWIILIDSIYHYWNNPFTMPENRMDIWSTDPKLTTWLSYGFFKILLHKFPVAFFSQWSRFLHSWFLQLFYVYKYPEQFHPLQTCLCDCPICYRAPRWMCLVLCLYFCDISILRIAFWKKFSLFKSWPKSTRPHPQTNVQSKSCHTLSTYNTSIHASIFYLKFTLCLLSDYI